MQNSKKRDSAVRHIYEAFHKTFFNSSKGYYEACRIVLCLVPEENVHTVIHSLIKDIQEKNHRLDTGCLCMNITVPFGAAAKVYLPTAHSDAVTINKLPLSGSNLIRETGTENGSLYIFLKNGSYQLTILQQHDAFPQ